MKIMRWHWLDWMISKPNHSGGTGRVLEYEPPHQICLLIHLGVGLERENRRRALRENAEIINKATARAMILLATDSSLKRKKPKETIQEQCRRPCSKLPAKCIHPTQPSAKPWSILTRSNLSVRTRGRLHHRQRHNANLRHAPKPVKNLKETLRKPHQPTLPESSVLYAVVVVHPPLDCPSSAPQMPSQEGSRSNGMSNLLSDSLFAIIAAVASSPQTER